jgi:hypothetical protein
MRFVLDVGDATGVRASELVGAMRGKVALPPLACTALEPHLVQRKLPVTPARWNPKTPRAASLGDPGRSSGDRGEAAPRKPSLYEA